MKFFKTNGQPMPASIVDMALRLRGRDDAASRREFLAVASAFGASLVTSVAASTATANAFSNTAVGLT